MSVWPLAVICFITVAAVAHGDGVGGTCQCKKSTSWDGSFSTPTQQQAFCSSGWGSSTPYMCAGGDGASGGAAPCGTSACSGGQYTFPPGEGWKIKVTRGGNPYRAFAFVKFCQGKQIGECWKGKTEVKFSFSFKTEGMQATSKYVKLLFWTDNGNLLGLLPSGHPKAGGQYKLITFMGDDYPNKFQDSMPIKDDEWYHAEVIFSFPGIVLKINGKEFSKGQLTAVNPMRDNNGPQLGAYIFGGDTKFNLWINDACVGEYSGTCPSARPKPTPAPPPIGDDNDDDDGGRRRGPSLRRRGNLPGVRRREAVRRRRGPGLRRRSPKRRRSKRRRR